MGILSRSRGGGGGGGTGVSEAEAIALIEARDDVIDGTPENIPAASASQKLKLAPDNSGIVRTLVEKIDYAVPRSGTFSVYTHTHYRGPFFFAPYPGTDTDDVFFHLGHDHFARVTLISPNNYQWRTVSFTNALGTDAVWLGHQPTQADALAQIDTFDTTKAYYAYTSTDQNVMVLDNSTYVAGSGESRTQEWLSITGDTKERIAKLEGYTPTYWAQTIDEPTLISGDDTETIDAFNVDLLDQFFDSDTRARGRLVFDVRLEKVTNLRIDTTIRVKHGTTTIHTESVPLQNANTEFTSNFHIDVSDVENGITVEIETTNSDDTTQDVEVSEVKLAQLTWIETGGSGGLSAVTSDATLNGDGTSSDPLGVADEGVDTTQLADSAVETSKINNQSVTNAKISSNAVTNDKVANSAIDTAELADAAVETAKIADDAVTAAKIADNAVGSGQIAAAAVGSSEIASFSVIASKINSNAVTTNKIASDAVTTAKIDDDAVTNAKVANDAIQNAQLADNAVRDEQIASDLNNTEQQNIRTKIGAGSNTGGITAVSSDATLGGDGTSSDPLGIADGGVGTTQLAADAVTGAKVADDAVDTEHLADDAVEQAQIADNAVQQPNLASNSVITAKIQDAAVTNAKVADDAIDTAQIADSAVDTAQLANSAVNGDKIGAGVIIAAHLAQDAITPSKIETNAVETDKIDDDAVTTAKIADNAVGSGQIANDAVTNAKIADDAVQTPQIQDGAVTQDKLASGVGGSVADGGITTAKLADGAVTTPKVADGAITAAKLASGVGNTVDIAPSSRAESLTLQGSGSITSPAYSAALLSGTTSPVAVEFGTGDAEILSVTAGESTVTVLKAGVYHLEWEGQVDITNERPIPRIEVYNSDDTIGTDTPLARLSAVYFRGNGTNLPISVAGVIIIPSDNTTIKFANSSGAPYSPDEPVFSVDTGQKVYFSRGAAGGLTEAEVEDFVSEHVSHTIRRRNIVGGGVLQVGDARIDADSIEINVDQDTEDGWFGDLEAGAEIRIHGLTSGARSMYTLVSVTESGDDATLTVTRDSHNGIFSHNETIVIVFDQEHAPQSDWDEADSNRPAYIKNKPTLAPSGAEANVQADWDEADTSSDAHILNKPTLAPSGAEENVQADWDEATTTDDAYIQNKPTVLTQADVEDITSEHIVHVIRRRLIIGGGVLQRGDVRIGATTIEINTHDDTDDGWFGELPTGTAIIIRGLTSGTRRTATLQSVSESGDDATLTVTFDSTGVFSHNETVIMTFDQAHTSQSDWDETDTDRPAYIKNKPTYFNNPRSFYYGRGGASAQIQSSRVDVVVTDFGSGTIRSTLRFQTTADETDFGGSDSLATWTDADDQSDIDVAGVFRRDDSVFELPAGTYDISFYLKTDNDELADLQGVATIYLAQIQSGTDDIEITAGIGVQSSNVANSNTSLEFHYKSLRAASGDLFYFAEQDFVAAHDAGYYVMIERLS